MSAQHLHVDQTLDTSGLNCPFPLLHTKKALNSMESGEVLKVICTDSSSVVDFLAFTEMTGHVLILREQHLNAHYFFIRKK